MINDRIMTDATKTTAAPSCRTFDLLPLPLSKIPGLNRIGHNIPL
jgi:hypothetical protein